MLATDMKELRKAKIAARNHMPSEERVEFSGRIAEQIMTCDWYREAKIIMMYRAVKGEVDLGELIADAGKQGKAVVYPKCLEDYRMIALKPLTEEAWEQGYKGIMEPSTEHSEVISPEYIDLVICPCTAFDEEGHRMGMGAGFYDRFLPQCINARVVAVAFEAQKTAHIDAQEWDVPMDEVFTEAGIYSNENTQI